jgi:serine/threonine-protein phosphatase 2A catalytic subunit
MDTNMEDVKMPDPMQVSSVPSTEPTTIPTLDGWIESLMACKQLAESDVQRLCDKVIGLAPLYAYPERTLISANCV